MAKDTQIQKQVLWRKTEKTGIVFFGKQKYKG